MTTNIGGISADFGLATARFNRDIADATRRLDTGAGRMNRALGTMEARWSRFSRGIGRAARGLFTLRGAMGIAAGATGMGYLINRAIDAADNIGKTADAIGLTTDQLQAMRFQAGEAGVGVQALDTALRTAARNFGDFRQGRGTLFTVIGGDEELTQSLRGVDNLSDALEVFADRYVATTDELERRSLAAALFGGRGLTLANVLRQGSEGMREYRAEAQRLGLVIGEDMVRNAEASRDALDRLGRIVRTQLTNALVQSTPQITEFATTIVENMPRIITQLERLGQVLGLFDKPIGERLSDAFGTIDFTPGVGSGGIPAALAQAERYAQQNDFASVAASGVLGPNNPFAARARAIREAIAEIEAIAQTGRLDFLTGTLLDPAMPAGSGMGATITSAGEAAGVRWWSGFSTALASAGGSGAGGAGDAARSEVWWNVANNAMSQAAALEGRLTAKGGLFSMQGGLVTVGGEAVTVWDRAAERMKEFSAQATDLEGQITSSLGQALKGLERQLVDAFMTGKFSARDFANELLRLAAEIAVRNAIIGPLTNLITSGLSSLGSGFGGGAGTPAGTVPIPKPIKAATGANFTVGGTSGRDRNPFFMMLERGEKVNVTAANDVRAGAGGGGGGMTVEIHNYSGAPVKQQRERGPNGRDVLRVTVGEMIGDGAFDKPMGGRFGSSPRPAVR